MSVYRCYPVSCYGACILIISEYGAALSLYCISTLNSELTTKYSVIFDWTAHAICSHLLQIHLPHRVRALLHLM